MWTLVYKAVALAIEAYSGYKLKRAETEVEKEKVRAEAQKNKDTARVALLSKGGWWFQLFYIIPLGMWFAGVIIYSGLWCQDCIYPQPWTIAELPAPLDEWAGYIIAYLFLVNARKG